ncbi:MAG: SPOR domain-containing protein, partial [Rhodothermales bacterium]|nr:SPOR domain-containing protein [Rhodothermales bacterium]
PPDPSVPATAPFGAGQVVWVAGVYATPTPAEEAAGPCRSAGLRAGILQTNQNGSTRYLLAVGGYRTENEALRARSDVQRVADGPLWLLRLSR